MESDPRIIQEAFKLTGNEQEFIDTYGEDFTGRIDLRNACTYVDDDGNVVIIDPSCEIPPSNPGGGGSSRYTTNDCGCKIFKDTRRPGGAVKVEDTQFNDFRGVRRVEVVAKNSWFTRRRVNTDDKGCWRIDRQFKGKAWFWVRFMDKVSRRGKIRMAGAKTWKFWQKARTASVFLGVKRGPNFHDIRTKFGRWDGGTKGTRTHYGWAAATVNNSLHEFRDYARRERFISPPNRLNVMVFLGREDGFTTMLRQLGAKDFTAAVTMGLGFMGANEIDFTVDGGLGQFFSWCYGAIGLACFQRSPEYFYG